MSKKENEFSGKFNDILGNNSAIETTETKKNTKDKPNDSLGSKPTYTKTRI